MAIHSDILLHIVMNLLSPLILTPLEMDAIGRAMNEVNDCNLSSVYHSAMSKLSSNDSDGNNIVNEGEDNNYYLNIFENYGRRFASSNGFHMDSTIEYEQLVALTSENKASAVKSVAYYEQFENLFGNTIMAFLNGTLKGKSRSDQSFLFEILFLVYYFPLYVLLAIYYTVMQSVPVVYCPTVVYKVNYVITSIIKTVYIIPVGLISFLVRSVANVSPPLEAVPEYIEIPSDEPGRTIFHFVKPKPNMKVGLRFGSNRMGGLTISNIKPNGIASTTGLCIGDLVHTINGIEVKNTPPKKAAGILLSASGVVRMEVSHGKHSVQFDEGTV